jgi:vitamin B12 transporter
MRFSLLTAFLLSFSILFVSTTQAGDEFLQETLPEIVVTATKMEEPEKETTQDITIITAEEIRKRGVEFVVDILRQVSDINVVQNGGFGKNATLFLRGGSPNQTVIMIDGVKVKSPTTGSFDFSGLTVDDIERIEIVKGAQSTLYGSEAMAGVINIITKRGKGKPKITLTLQGGSYTTAKTSFDLSGSSSAVDYRVTASYFNTKGISAAKAGTEDDSYRNVSFSTKVGINPFENLFVDLNLRYYRDTSELDSFEFGVGMVDDLNFTQEGEHYLFSVKGNLSLTDNYEQILNVSFVKDYLSFKDPDTLFNNATIDTNMKSIDWQHNIYFDGVVLTAGAEYRKESGENVGNFDVTVDAKAVYLNTKVTLLHRNLIINAGARYDDHEFGGNRITYRTGLLYRFPFYGLRLRASYGTGFRAPTLNELFFPFFGNLELKPEKSRSFDIEVSKDFYNGLFTLSANYFEQRYRDLIEYDFNTFTAQNIGKAEVKGFEIESEIRPFEGLAIVASYTNLDAEDKDTGAPLTRRPHHKFVVNTTYVLNRLMLHAQFLYVSERYDAATDRDLSSFSLVNLSGSYELKENLSFFARIDNLLDEDYEEAGGYSTPGRCLFGGLRVTF